MWADKDSGDVMIAGSWWGFAVVSVTVGFGVAGKLSVDGQLYPPRCRRRNRPWITRVARQAPIRLLAAEELGDPLGQHVAQAVFVEAAVVEARYFEYALC
jgi:hypothetical protein